MDPILGSIQLFGFPFAPQGWVFCDGQLLSIAQNQALFALIGTIYGGDGVNTFAVPDLRGRAPVHIGQARGGSTYVIGQSGGTENTSLTTQNLPAQVIPATGLTVTTTVKLANEPSSAATTPTNTNAYIGASAPSGPVSAGIYSDQPGSAPVTLKGVTNTVGGAITVPGASAPFSNQSPYLALNFCIAVQGIFPTRQ